MALQPKYENSHALIIGVNQYNKAPPLAYACNDAEAVDLLVKLAPSTMPSLDGPQTFADRFKELLSDPAQRIPLDDFVATNLKSAVNRLSIEHFPLSHPYTDEEFVVRVGQYEATIDELIDIVVLLSRWARPDQLPQLERIFVRLAESLESTGGLSHWIDLRWYPILVLMYAAGISALSARNYDALTLSLCAPVNVPARRAKGEGIPLVFPVVEHLTDIVPLFKKLPGQERRYTPRSDHLLTVLQPKLEDALFLGGAYEDLFDKFEVLLALTHAELYEPTRGDWWGPPGRFAWMHNGASRAPFEGLVNEAKKAGNAWGLLRGGLFHGNLDRFLAAADGYRKLMKNLAWH